jgi:hypothetical protein
MFQHKVQLSDSEALSLRWTADWSLLTIKFNTTQLENITDKSVLEAGKWFTLPTGKNLFVRLVKGELEVWDGTTELMSGLKSGQSDHYGMAWKILIGCGIVFSLLGLSVIVNIVSNDGTSSELGIEIGFGFGIALAILGLGYVGLALWARKTKEKLPLQIAMGVHSVVSLCMLLTGLIPSLINGIIINGLYKGIKAEPLRTNKFESVEDTGLLDDDL